MERNIALSKLITPAVQTWFWLGIWLPYYLTFTNYAGVGLIESFVYITIFLLEIPTGALADLLGKKTILSISIAATTLGNLTMAFSQNLQHLYIAVALLGIGGALFSGANEALIFDSLKSINKDEEYEKVTSKNHIISLFSMGIASVVGGYMYSLNHSLPFLFTAFITFIAFILTFFLKEPAIDTQIFNLKNYLNQSKQGLKQLFKHSSRSIWIIKLLITFSFAFILLESVETSMAIDLGFSQIQLGYLYALLPIVTAVGAYCYPLLKKKLGDQSLWLLTTLSLLLTCLVSPFLGFYLGLGFIIFRNLFFRVIDIQSSSFINRFVEPSSRATTLSTFNMIKSAPYILTSYFIGSLIDKYSALKAVSLLAATYLFAVIIVSFISAHSSRQANKG